ncbi:MAG TPA: DUF1684 domain-containing protein [Gammaproteobacteria bacterium]|nr:DUF1684 domain-containing protein [Gammaproteobacteria bacterium]
MVSYQQEIRDWQSRRLSRLTAEDGWTTLVGLLWLDAGDNSFGRVASNKITLDHPALPEQVGTFRVVGTQVDFTATPTAEILHDGRPVTTISPLIKDAAGKPTVLKIGTLSFYLLERSGRLAIRVRDSAADTRTHFQGLMYFPVDEKWRLSARFEPFQPVKNVSIVNVLGMQEDMLSPGVLVFEVDGRQCRLEAVLESGETDYFVMFTDLTNGKQTYAAGRCLYVSPPVGGVTVIDFNKAYNPPCCFTAFATCALPPLMNRLPIAVNAGELKYAGSDH